MVRRTLLATLMVLCAVLLLAELRYRGAPVVPRDGDPRTFSAARAREEIAVIASQPHATGTPALAAARGYVAARLRAFGLAPEERSTFVCGRYGVCARVNQVLARIRGTASTGTVLLLAHLDAVGAGFGASDDGAGSGSLLEIARALGGPQRNDVIVLFVEGEELGLLGADAFVREDPIAREVSVVINLEARGSRGPASLFQISRNSRFVIDAAGSIPRPVGSSLFAAIYERMPNDTDLSVFLARGYGAMNFAFTGGVENYHTAHDDLAHQDARSVQHLGESALAVTRALGAIDLKHPSRGDVIFFDVLALGIVRYPMSWAMPLAIVVLVAALGVAGWRRRVGEIALGVATWLLAIVMASLLGVAVYAAVRASGAFAAPWIAQPAALIFAMIAAALCAVLTAVAVARRLISAESLAIAIAIMHAVLGVVVARVLPGGSYLFVVPALVGVLASFAPRGIGRGIGIGATAIVQATLWIVLIENLYPVLGVMAAPALSLTVAMMIAPLAPLLLDAAPSIARPFGLAFGAFTVVATVFALFAKPFTPDVPQRVNVAVVREDGAMGKIGVDPTWVGNAWGPPPPAMLAALHPTRTEPLAPWRDDAHPVAEVALDVPAPEVTIVESDAHRLRLHIRTVRDASSIYIIGGLGLVRVEIPAAVGASAFFRRQIAAGYRGVRIEGVPELEVIATFAGAPDVFIGDATYGVPDAAKAVVAARPSDAVPTQDGDVTIAYRHIRP